MNISYFKIPVKRTQMKYSPLCFPVTVHGQCQLVKNFENRINSLNIGIKYHSEMNPGANGVDHAICRTVLLFDCMVNSSDA